MNSTHDAVLIHSPKSPAAEAYRSLRTNIQFCGVDKPIRTIAVTSATPSEGKSTTAINLAVSMAYAGQHVLLLDADLRRPVVHKVFGLPNQVGLTNLLIGDQGALESALQDTTITGLRVLTSGPIPPNPAELLGSQNFRTTLDALRDLVDVVIVDTPPVMAVTDAALVGSRVDGVILVVNSGTATRPATTQAKGILENVKANILGVVLNQVDAKSGDYYYYYYYGQRRKKKSAASS